jgi:aspartate kinase
MKVVKFGGTSVANPNMFKQIKSIIMADPSRKIVVCSAPGKDKDSTSKVTDLLYLLHEHVKYNINYKDVIDKIKNRFLNIKNSLDLTFDIENYFLHLKEQLQQSISRDELVSRGEFLTATLLAEYLGYDFVDAKEVVPVNFDGSFDYKKGIASKVLLQGNKGIVVPGFYGNTPSNDIMLLSRGGSDITASFLAYTYDATCYENFSDVSGLFSASPSIIDAPKHIDEISYIEVRELSYRGASVFHPEAIIPASKKDIPIVILNTFNPKEKGTTISKEAPKDNGIVTAIAGKEHFTVFNISKDKQYSKVKILTEILTLLSRYHIEIEHIPSGIDSFSVIVDTGEIGNNKLSIMNELHQIEGITNVGTEENLALVAIVGRNMANTPGVAGKIFGALGKEQVNIKVIAQASTELSVIVGVDGKDYQKAIKAIYNVFF